MPIKRVKQFTAWSYSRLTRYEECPLWAKLQLLDKLRNESNAAMERGSRVHDDLGKFLVKPRQKLPEEAFRFAKELRALKKAHPIIEQELAVDVRWKPCSWFAPEAWCRVKLDAVVWNEKSCELVVIDFKTGRVRAKNEEQLDLYGTVAYSSEGLIERVTAELWYLDEGELQRKTYMRTDALRLRKVWEKRTKKLLTDRSFKPTPGNHCRWCPFQAVRGGPCEF